MQKKEKELFKQLCSFRSDRFDKELLQHASPAVLGHLFFNRMQGAAYSVLKKNECLGDVNREFRNSLKGAYEQNVERNRSFFQCVRLLSGLLAQCGCSAAMLKGALLAGCIRRAAVPQMISICWYTQGMSASWAELCRKQASDRGISEMERLSLPPEEKLLNQS